MNAHLRFIYWKRENNNHFNLINESFVLFQFIILLVMISIMLRNKQSWRLSFVNLVFFVKKEKYNKARLTDRDYYIIGPVGKNVGLLARLVIPVIFKANTINAQHKIDRYTHLKKSTDHGFNFVQQHVLQSSIVYFFYKISHFQVNFFFRIQIKIGRYVYKRQIKYHHLNYLWTKFKFWPP